MKTVSPILHICVLELAAMCLINVLRALNKFLMTANVLSCLKKKKKKLTYNNTKKGT